jgi:hypothetical protein
MLSHDHHFTLAVGVCCSCWLPSALRALLLSVVSQCHYLWAVLTCPPRWMLFASRVEFAVCCPTFKRRRVPAVVTCSPCWMPLASQVELLLAVPLSSAVVCRLWRHALPAGCHLHRRWSCCWLSHSQVPSCAGCGDMPSLLDAIGTAGGVAVRCPTFNCCRVPAVVTCPPCWMPFTSQVELLFTVPPSSAVVCRRW